MANVPANNLADSPLALSGIGAGPPQEMEYDAVYAAVTATERGRWFLTEFARRNRHADTGTLVAALSRIEAAVGAAAGDIGAGTDGLERVRRIAPANADDARAADDTSSAADAADGRPEESGSSTVDGFEFELQDREQFAAAAAALAASLNVLDDQAADEALPVAAERQSSAAAIPPHDYMRGAALPQPERAASNPRWQIEPPDFVFQQARASNGAAASSSDDGRTQRSLLPGPQLLPNPEEDPAELFVPAAEVAAMPRSSAAPAAEREPAPATPPAEPVANAIAPPVRAVARPGPLNPLAALNALTEDELLALFG